MRSGIGGPVTIGLDESEEVVREGVVGMRREETSEQCRGLVVPAEVAVDLCEMRRGRRVLGAEGEDTLEMHPGGLVVTGLLRVDSTVVRPTRVIRHVRV